MNRTAGRTAPTTTKRTVTRLRVVGERAMPPGRKANADTRTREYLTEGEVEQLCHAARKRGRYGHRDAAMILLAYRHGLRVSELVGLRWTQVDLDGGKLHVARLKGSDDSVHPLAGVEIRALRQIRREQLAGARHVFLSERGAPIGTAGFARMLTRTAEAAGLGELRAHPHMLRHAAGYKLANAGHDTRAIQLYLGHRQIQHTVRYTQLAAGRFEGFWKD
jgi:site-specific recombinase XerD